ncbi:MAG: hypothetical protein JWP89_5094 [Schlesneria sp.]|nr:hypothetical protein [Schlesneria sp.]
MATLRTLTPDGDSRQGGEVVGYISVFSGRQNRKGWPGWSGLERFAMPRCGTQLGPERIFGYYLNSVRDRVVNLAQDWK